LENHSCNGSLICKNVSLVTRKKIVIVTPLVTRKISIANPLATAKNIIATSLATEKTPV
jgi:hypothetical protein